MKVNVEQAKQSTLDNLSFQLNTTRSTDISVLFNGGSLLSVQSEVDASIIFAFVFSFY